MKLPPTLFATSFTLAVAAGLVQLDAGPDADGPAAAPAQHEITVDGHKLEVSIDRDRVPAGETVKVAITPTDGAHGEEVRVAVLQQIGSPASRSMPPPREISHQNVVVGGEAVSLELKLAGPAAGKGVDPLQVAGNVTQYTVVVSGKKDRRDGAYLPVFAYQPEAYQLTIEPLAAGKPGDAVDVAVRVKSKAGKPLTQITVGLSSALVTFDNGATIASLAPGAETVVHLKGHRQQVDGPGPVVVQAYGYAGYGGSASAWAKVDPAKGTLVERGSTPLLGDLVAAFGAN